MTILITTPTFSAYDAVSNDIRAMYKILSQTYDCKIYAEHRNVECAAYIEKKNLKKILSNKDNLLIYHHSVYWEVGKLFLKDAKCKIIFRYHNITPPAFYERYNETHLYACLCGEEQTGDLVHDFPDALWLCNSLYTATTLTSVPEEKKAACPPFNITEQWTSSDSDEVTLQNLRHCSKTVNLLFTGRVVPNKGHLFLVDVLNSYVTNFDTNIKLRVVGSIDKGLSGYMQEIKNNCKIYGLEQYVEFIGEVNDSQMLAYYTGSNIFISGSEHEGFFVPAAEAQYLKLPVIARAKAAVPETLGDNQLLLGENPKEYAAAINLLHNNENYRNFLITAGYRNFESRFSTAKITEVFLDAFAKFLKQYD